MYRLRGKGLGDAGYGAFGSHVDDLFSIGDSAGLAKTETILSKQFKVKSDSDRQW